MDLPLFGDALQILNAAIQIVQTGVDIAQALASAADFILFRLPFRRRERPPCRQGRAAVGGLTQPALEKIRAGYFGVIFRTRAAVLPGPFV